jgi:hypothetical protein
MHSFSVARVGDRQIAAGLLGTYAEDCTFQWSWAGAPEAVHSERLKQVGGRHNVPELVEPLTDLGGFPDPRAAADDLAVMALGLLGVNGMIRYGHGGRALSFIITEDPALTPEAPDPAKAAGMGRNRLGGCGTGEVGRTPTRRRTSSRRPRRPQ